jgi:hypothetical protein
MHLVRHPRGAPLVAEGGFRVVGRVEPLPRRRQGRRRAPANPIVLDLELAEPDPAQELSRGDLPQPGGRGVAPQRLQEEIPVGADPLGVCVPGLLAHGKARLPDPRHVAVEPLGGGLLAEQSRCDRRQGVEGGAERLADQLQAVEVAGGGQDVGRVGALAGTGPDQAAVLAGRQDLIQEESLGPDGHQSAAEFGEDVEAETGIVELEPEGLLPVDAAPDGVGGLTIGEVLGELIDGDQGELPGRQCGLSAPGESPAKSAARKTAPSSSRRRRQGFPLGKAARATRAVNSGTGEHGLHRHEGTSG